MILSGRELSEMESEIGKRLQDLKEAQEKERDALQERLREAESGSSSPRERSIMKSLARARSRLRNSEISAEAAAAVASGTAEQVKSALHETLLSRETEKERKFSEYFRSEVEARAERLRRHAAWGSARGSLPARIRARRLSTRSGSSRRRGSGSAGRTRSRLPRATCSSPT